MSGRGPTGNGVPGIARKGGVRRGGAGRAHRLPDFRRDHRCDVPGYQAGLGHGFGGRDLLRPASYKRLPRPSPQNPGKTTKNNSSLASAFRRRGSPVRIRPPRPYAGGVGVRGDPDYPVSPTFRTAIRPSYPRKGPSEGDGSVIGIASLWFSKNLTVFLNPTRI